MKKVFFLFCGVFLLFGMAGFSQTLPTGFSVSNIASGWNQPVGARFTSDGQRLFVWEKGGTVYVCNRNAAGTYIKQSTVVINISEEVGDWRDHGLLGFTIDPNFSTNGYIYLLYVVDRHHLMNFGTPSYNPSTNAYFAATISRVTRYQTSTTGGNLVATIASRTVLIGETRQTGIPLLYESHSIGALEFAADGTLLVSTGDGASYSTTDPGNVSHTYFAQALTDGIIRPAENVGAFRAQLLDSHDGKLLRINPVNGDGIPSNPFYSAATPRAPKSRVWALGFRNPFRFTIKPGTGSTNPAAGDIGEIYVGDVGWNIREDLSIINDKGVNCGWPIYEGLDTLNSYANLTTANMDEPNPLFNTGGCTQQYFTFRNLLKQDTIANTTTIFNPCNNTVPIGSNNRYFHHRPSLDWRHGQDITRVGIFKATSPHIAINANIGTPESGATGAQFRGNASVAGCWYTGTLFPANFRNTFFQADYGGQWLKSMTVNFTDKVTNVQGFGTGFAAIVYVTQNPLDGTMVYVDLDTQSIRRITYGGNQLPVVRMTSDKTFGPSVLNVAFTGNTSSDPDGTIAAYAWNFGDGGTSTTANPSHNFSAPPNTPTGYAVKLTVTDNAGATSIDSIIISVNNTPPVVNITSPIDNSFYTPGSDTLYACTATVTDAEHTPAQLKYAWQSFLRHNNHSHPEPIDTTRNTFTNISRIGCNGDTYYWHIQLTVTDGAGLSTIDSSELFPDCLGGALPVFLRKFSVSQLGNTNLVKWSTELEENLNYFEVERSSDGLIFIPVDRQPARNLLSTNDYSFADNGFAPGISYYRLKIVELNGQIRFSLIIKTVSDNKNNSFTITPNPGKGNFAVIFNTTKDEPVTIQIRDVSGKLLHTIRENVTRGQNVIYTTGLENRQAGLYIISLKQGDNITYGKYLKGQ